MLPWKTFVLRFAWLLVLSCTARLSAQTLRPQEFAAASVGAEIGQAVAVSPLRLIVGFMGGRVRADNLLHKEAAMAQDLRRRNGKDLQVLVFANHDGRAALRTVLALVDRNGDHLLSKEERTSVDIAIYGHSWGASEAVNLARSLQKEKIPVALTVQVDSVQKAGEDDQDIPSNVQQAVNLFQRDGLLRGRDSIRAEDASKTHILVNQQYHYQVGHTVDIAQFPWFARTFMRQHIMIENDPEVWERVEGFLNEAVQRRSN